jgi:ATP-dependent RNA helicase DeaD
MQDDSPSFAELGLSEAILHSLSELGYEKPSPIQAKSIGPLLEGKDILGQAQTGTGKTAAFALPIVQSISVASKTPQALILAPTRELAIQVAEAFKSYARGIKGLQVLPIYGGQAYDSQIRALKRGVQVVVGTPGRVMDHIRKGTLKLGGLTHLVLDEADEMLRMGFIDDVEWVMSHTPEEKQIALFSATMPREIAKVANTYLKDPVHVKIEVKTVTADTIHQRYWPVGGVNKLDALTRILEAETFDAMIIFVRTKTSTVTLAEKLEARGFRAAALNGDISQQLRERTVDRLKKNQTDILVATDVAARGLDVERISHVVNYDIPYDSEAYVHRIGRTGRAGRQGEAILFVARREQRMLKSIERATGKPIEPMSLPSLADINDQRVQRFKESIAANASHEDVDMFKSLIAECQQEFDLDVTDVAASLACMLQGDQSFFLKAEVKERRESRDEHFDKPKPERRKKPVDPNMDRYRIEVGRDDGVSPGNIVGAIANEGEIQSKHIGHIALYDTYSTVELPKGMPRETFQVLAKTWVCNKQLKISLVREDGSDSGRKPKKKPFNKKRKGGGKKSKTD